MLRATRRGWLAAFLLMRVASAANADYVAETRKWQQDFDAEVRTGGWLSLIGRFKIEEGLTTIGNDASCTVTLPQALAPQRFGNLTRRGDTLRFEPQPGLKATLDGHPLVAATLLSPKSGTGQISAGNLRLSFRAVGDDLYMIAADTKNPALQEFKGTTWYPIDPAYRVKATFAAHDQPQRRRIPMTHVDSEKPFLSTGDVMFRHGGDLVRLTSFVDGGELFVMFRDQTNGKETYGGGRFLYAPLPVDGKTVLDFNKAFSPYCAVNVYVMCPIAPPENRLNFKVTAGETYVSKE
jgi:uncharacterized protein (DUF1684 family)